LTPTPASAPGSGDFSLVRLPDGSSTLRSLELGETFHPVIGPAAEADLHVRQTRIAERASLPDATRFIVWDIGLGAAANAIAALETLERSRPPIQHAEILSFDLDDRSLRFALEHVAELPYLQKWTDAIKALLGKGETQIGGIRWRFLKADLRDAIGSPHLPAPHAVFFDPYSPAANPEIWTVEVFSAIRAHARDGPCLLSNYSRSTAVRTSLLVAGWFVGHGLASGEKTETTVAATHLDLLSRPLDARWLDRLARSTAPGPLHGDQRAVAAGNILAARLRSHPQFESGNGCRGN
jgi:tRNA U34 5-methylaminomethyl-2-thiouridine-forming methyltransferase MnmC